MTRASIVLAALLFAVPLAAQTPTSAPMEPHVVVTGEGVVVAVPDRAWISISAESRAPSPREAQRLNALAMTPVQDKLKAAGLPAEAIRTSGYDVQYEWEFVNNRRVGKGYVARNTIEVRIDDVNKVAEYLEIAAGSGATALGGIRFDLKDRTALEREALQKAVADARAKADVLATAAGRTLDRVVRIDEGTTGGPVPYQPVQMRMAMAQSADVAPPISAGQTELRAQVTLTAILK